MCTVILQMGDSPVVVNKYIRWRWMVNATLRPLYTRERSVTHCVRPGRPQGRCGRVRKISPTPGFYPRTVQPVASRYTDRAIPAHHGT